MDLTPDLYKYEIVQINIRGARSNKANLESYLSEVNFPEIVCINETKLPANKKFEINGYNVAARREHGTIGGSRGSMILTRCDIADVVEIEYVKDFFKCDEIIGIDIKKTNKRPSLRVFTYYNPPLTTPNEAIFRYISTINDKCILVGDINCKNTVWGSSKTDRRGVELLEMLSNHNLVVYNDGNKTRYDPVSGKEECLDLTIGNIQSSNLFHEFWVGYDVGSDHFPVHSTFQFRNPTFKSPIETRKCEKLNTSKWNRILRDIPPIHQARTPAELERNAEFMTESIKIAFENSCPLTKIRKMPKCAFTPEIKAKVKEKRKLRREKNAALEAQNHFHVRLLMTRINRIGNEIKKLQSLEKKKSLEKHCLSLNSEQNAKKFFNTFSVLAKDTFTNEAPSSLQRPIEDEWGNRASTGQEKAKLFASRLQKIHQEPNYSGFDDNWKNTVETFLAENERIFQPDMNETYTQPEFGDDSIMCNAVTIDELDATLAKCKNRSAAGRDGVNYFLLKKLPKETKSSLCLIFSDAIRLGHFPLVWKSALVKMLPKPNKDTKLAKNFRPISLLSCIGKILERILAKRLSDFMEENNMFAKSQSGFRRHRMTTEQLIRLSEESHIAFKKQQSVAALFLDAEAAFDKCWHNGIRYKLKKMNIPDRIVRLLSSFLTGRTLTVLHEGKYSHEVRLGAGTPQGSPLSPLIYLIYVNDYPAGIEENCSLSQFADDTAMWTAAYSRAFATRKLQKSLNLLEGWCRRWRVKLNGEKSHLIFISRNREKESESYALQLFNDIIHPVDSAKFLGLEIDGLLSFKNHFDDIVNRSVKRLNVLKVLSRNGTNPKTLLKLYKSYVRPVTEYGSIAFLTAPKFQLRRLQQVQNDAIRICLRLPKYIRADLIHEYASLEPIDNRLLHFNKNLLKTMTRHNCHIESLVSNHSHMSSERPTSPIDLLLAT